MGKKIILKFGNEIEKTPVPWRDVDIEKVLASNKISFGEKKL